MLEVVIFSVILGDLADSVYYHNTLQVVLPVTQLKLISVILTIIRMGNGGVHIS